MKTLFLLLLALSFQVAQAEPVEETATVSSPPTVAAVEPVVAAVPEAAKPLPQAESEIPLNIEPEKKAAPAEGMTGKIVYSLAILLLMGGGLYFLVRRYSIPRNSTTQAQIKVISQHHFGPKRSLALVRVAGESILIGITDHNINLVKSLSLLDEDVPEDVPKNFSKTLQQKSQETGAASADPEEDFAVAGIKDVVHKRLQSMRNFQ